MRVCLALLAAALTGCATLPTSPLPQWATVAPTIMPVSLDVGRPAGDGTFHGFCAGTLVAPAQVLTAYHCIAGEAELLVRRGADGALVRATVLKTDPAKDLALLGGAVPWEGAPARLGPMPQVGDWVWVVGHPAGDVSRAVSHGVVSALGLTGTPYWPQVPLLVTDAMAIGGNSGGGVFNTKGQLVGVLVGGWREGFSFAVPVTHIDRFLH